MLYVSVTFDFPYIEGMGARMLNFTRENFYKCTMNTKHTAYIIMAYRTLEYASSVWDPHVQNTIHSVEMVQR